MFIKSFIVSILVVANSRIIDALPSGSPVCTVGSAAPQSLHLSRPVIVTGGLPLGGFQVKIGTTTLVGGSSVNTIAANTNLALEVSSVNGTQFRGVLVVLNQPSVNLVSNMFISSSSTTLQVQSSCVFSNYAGFTHTSNALKSLAQATINLPINQAAFLDVNVVVSNSDLQGSFYYHTRYQLSAVAAPVPAPVPAPVATAPVPVPVPVPVVRAPVPVVVAPPVPVSVPVPVVRAPVPVGAAPPVPVPVSVPVSSPVVTTPIKSPTRAPCGLFGLSFFCLFSGCGFLRRLFGRC